jgi:hypothetical protein
MNKYFIFLFYLVALCSHSQDSLSSKLKELNKVIPDPFSTEKIGVIPSFITINIDENYYAISKEEKYLIQKYDSIINDILSKKLTIEFIKYSNIDKNLIDKKIGWLTGTIEHGRFNTKISCPKKIIKINPERYQIGLSLKSNPIYKTKRSFFYLFIFDRLINKTIGYEQLVIDFFPIYNYNDASDIFADLVINLNSLILRI